MGRWIASSLILLLLAFAQLSSTAAEAPRGDSKKRGIAGWGRGQHEKAGAVWYYNWMPQPNKDGSAAEFVPMVKGDNFGWQLGQAKKHVGPGKPLLCLNEPERADQGNMTVEKAIEVWPKLMETAARLSSPAPSSDGSPIWVTEFNAWKVGEREHVRFLKGATRALERLSFVERYAYFTWKPGEPGSLFNRDGSLSELGEVYRRAK